MTEVIASTQRTPGPWSVETYTIRSTNRDADFLMANVLAPNEAADLPNTSYGGKYVSVCTGLDNIRDAALIAAAPDLLAVCEAIVERYNTDDRMGGLGDWLLSAITKARGEVRE